MDGGSIMDYLKKLEKAKIKHVTEILVSRELKKGDGARYGEGPQ